MATARRNASRFHCDVLAVYVKGAHLSANEQKSLEGGLAKAREEGAHVEVLEGDDPIEAIVRYARSHSVTQIFVGHSAKKDFGTLSPHREIEHAGLDRLRDAGAGLGQSAFERKNLAVMFTKG